MRGCVQVLRTVLERQDYLHAHLGRLAHGRGRAPEWSGKIVHATLVIGNTRLQGSDPAPGSYESPRGFDITLNPSEGDAERLFTELAAGGTVRMPVQETFWAVRFGVLTDRFGIPWAINCHGERAKPRSA